MRIAVDIDSTLHDYWGVLSEISVRRFGVKLPYEEQLTWGLTRLRPEQLALCVKESHSDERILAGVPYPGAVEAVRGWRERGHSVYVASNRHSDCREATAAWLAAIGLPFDDLLCSAQKLERCLELGVELLVDDSPMSILGALDHGIVAATIVHPWNEEVCEEEDVICARAWHELARALEPVLEGAPVGIVAAGG
jgi:FMN phosphatase YigB (HAD superfamily)